VHKKQCQMYIFTEAGEVLQQRIHTTHFAPMWLNAHGQPCSTPDRHVDSLHSFYCLRKPHIFETSLCMTAVCKYGYINQQRGKSHKIITHIKVSVVQSW
jgi:hypothetical protein